MNYESGGGSKVRLALFLFLLLMESGFKYSILRKEKFLLGHPHLLGFISCGLGGGIFLGRFLPLYWKISYICVERNESKP